ncbi:serine/threonine-protein kinase [Candidatus Uabimicrobium sp. HlEnr_7]|uniref:serine/threonine-protein kinase n=1 Tax=Candidatus Uabimicrobium helgolandensis TaxID=3095367 RepID=UPI003558D77E
MPMLSDETRDINLPDGYQFIDRIGEGGMGAVFLVSKGNEKVVLKTVKEELKNQINIHKLATEGKIQSCFNHDNIVKVFDILDNGEMKYVEMEYVEGKSLHRYVDENEHKNVGCDDYMEIVVRGIAEGLKYLHNQGYIHCDLKPQNVLIHKNGDKIIPKVADFGLAKKVNEFNEKTEVSKVIGTVHYMSADRLKGKTESKVDDLYSLGAIIFFCAHGYPPFFGKHIGNLVTKILDMKYEWKADNYSDKWRIICSKCLKKEYSDIEDVCNDIEKNCPELQESTPKHKEILKLQTSRDSNLLKYSLMRYSFNLLMVLLVLATFLFIYNVDVRKQQFKEDIKIIAEKNNIEKRAKAFIRLIQYGKQNFMALDLRRASLTGQQIIKINLPNTLFSEANLQGTTLRQSNFTNATFIGTNLRGVYAGGAKFRGANFTKADLSGAYMKGTFLKDADFTDAILDNVNFTIAKQFDSKQIAACKSMNNAFGLSKEFLEEVKKLNPNLLNDWWNGESTIPSFQNVEAKDAEFYNVRLEGADFSNSKFIRANFKNNKFQNVNFINSNLQDTDFTGANLKGANFKFANLQGVNFNQAILDGSDFRYTKNLTSKQIEKAKSAKNIIR